MNSTIATTEAHPSPASVPKASVSKLESGVRKAMPGAVQNLLHKLKIPTSAWCEVLIWLMRRQGTEVGHQWQLATTFATELEEQALPIDHAVWLLESLGEELAFRGKDSVFHGASLLLPGWDFVLDRLVIRSFSGQLERLRAIQANQTYRLGLLYARGQLGDMLATEEREEVLAALARTYLTMPGAVSALVPRDGELVLYDDINFENDDVDEDWAEVVRPFGSPEEWERAIGAAAAAAERIESRWERPTVFVDRLLRHADACSAEEMAIAITFGHVDEDACGGERGELAQRFLDPVDADGKSAVLAALRVVAQRTEREIPKEVSDVLMPRGADLVRELEALAAQSSLPCDTRIYVPVRGERSVNGVAEIAPGAYTPEVPECNGEPMEPLITLDLAEIPELQQRFGSEAVVFFLSALNSNGASELDSDELAVKPVSLEQARDFSEGTPFRLVPVDVPRVAFQPDPPPELDELASRLRTLPARLLGPPVFVQDDARTEGFVMQLDESFVDANFGGGVMYLYEDDGFWQC